MPKFFQFWLLGVLLVGSCISLKYPHHCGSVCEEVFFGLFVFIFIFHFHFYFEYLTFWHYKVLEAHLVYSLSHF